MKKVRRKSIMFIFAIALLINAILPAFVSGQPIAKKIEYKELSKILGETVYICAGNYEKGGYLSSFNILDQEQHQKLKKQIDLTNSFPVPASYKYINEVYSSYISALHSGAIKPDVVAINPETYFLSLKFSTAPPFIS